jgi:hypothetical protein
MPSAGSAVVNERVILYANEPVQQSSNAFPSDGLDIVPSMTPQTSIPVLYAIPKRRVVHEYETLP